MSRHTSNLDAGLEMLRDAEAAAEACRILIRAYRHDLEDVDWTDVDAALSRALAAFGLPADDPERFAARRREARP